MSHKIPTVLLWSFLLMPILGCNYITGNYIEHDKLSLLKENQTTKTEIIELIGKPDYIYPGKDGKGEIFIYYYMKDTKEKQNIILRIDDAGILQKMTVSEDSQESLKK